MLILPDFINGLFELLGGLFILISIRKLRKDKQVLGIAWVQVLFFTVWGYWNIFYYPYLGQIISLIGGIGVATTNTIYTILLIHYSKHT